MIIGVWKCLLSFIFGGAYDAFLSELIHKCSQLALGSSESQVNEDKSSSSYFYSFKKEKKFTNSIDYELGFDFVENNQNITFMKSPSNLWVGNDTTQGFSSMPVIFFLLILGSYYILQKKSNTKEKRIVKKRREERMELDTKVLEISVNSGYGYNWISGHQVISIQAQRENDIGMISSDESENFTNMAPFRMSENTSELLEKKVTMKEFIETRCKLDIPFFVEEINPLRRKLQSWMYLEGNESKTRIKNEFQEFIVGDCSFKMKEFTAIICAAMIWDYTHSTSDKERRQDKILARTIEFYRVQFRESLDDVIHLLKNQVVGKYAATMLEKYFIYCSAGNYEELEKFNNCVKSMINLVRDGFSGNAVFAVTSCNLLASLDIDMLQKTIADIVNGIIHENKFRGGNSRRVSVILTSLQVFLYANMRKITDNELVMAINLSKYIVLNSELLTISLSELGDLYFTITHIVDKNEVLFQKSKALAAEFFLLIES